MYLVTLRTVCRYADRSATISDHAPQPADSPRLSKWLRPRRITALLRTRVADAECHADQARESSWLIRRVRAIDSWPACSVKR